MLIQAWTLLHLLFAISYVASLVVGDVNSASARHTESWNERAALFGAVKRSSFTMGVVAMVLLGVFGNLLMVSSGYRMAADSWARWVNGLWLVILIVNFALGLPGLNALVKAANEGSAGNYQRALARWSISSNVSKLLAIALLVLMVFRWRG